MNNRLRVSGLALALMATACVSKPTPAPVAPVKAPVVVPTLKPLLETNVINGSFGGVNAASEDDFSVPRVKLYDQSVYVLPLSGDKGEALANSTIPAYQLITDAKARRTLTNVGTPGGKILIDSPEGFTFVPYRAEFDVTDPAHPKLKLRDLKDEKGLARLVVPSMSVPAIPTNITTNLGVDYITQDNMQFVTQTFGVGQDYAVFPMSTNQEFAPGLNKDNFLPLYFVARPFDVEVTGSNVSNPSVYGSVIVFHREDVSAYKTNRGLVPSTPAPGQPGAIGAPAQKP